MNDASGPVPPRGGQRPGPGGSPPAPGAPPPGAGAPPPTEEEMRAQLEEEMRRITVTDVVVQTVVSLVNLGGQRLGMTPDTRELRDLGQVRTAIEAVRALLPLLEQEMGDQVAPVRDALAQLQLAYSREVGAPPGAAEGAPVAPAGAQHAGPAGPPPGGAPGAQTARQRASGRLWVPPGSES